ncbi:MAG: c-type cytochrome biogenesis protein CcmI [Marinobacter sp.]|nr:c-type cytochrome biogenesis protein CcmI [Marinobacter sp.]
MTTTFWFAAAAMIALALAFIIAPAVLRRSRNRADDELRQQNLIAYRGRMAELDDDYRAGTIDPETYGQLRDELAGSMLDDVAERPSVVPARSGSGGARLLVFACVLFVPVLAVLLYQHWGALAQVEQWQTMKQMVANRDGGAEQVSKLADQLNERLQADPDNPQGWGMLGQTYMNLERYQDAAQAFEQLARLEAGAPQQAANAWGLVAQARFFGSQGSMTPAVTRAIDQARALNPDEVNSLGLLGINAFGQKDYQAAINYWERIAKVAPNHPQLSAIRKGIVAAYTRMGRPVPADSAAALSARGVTVKVELAPALADKVPDDTTLFVFARQPDRQGPPLAIARLTAADLPARVRLNDTLSMAPTARISSADQVLVTARLSRSGTAMPQSGDWQGSLGKPVKVDVDPDVINTVVIDQQIP